MAKKSHILILHKEGHRSTAISKKTNISYSTVSSFLIRHAKSSVFILKSKPGRGRKPKLDPRVERTLIYIIIKNINYIF
jgi:transposase